MINKTDPESKAKIKLLLGFGLLCFSIGMALIHFVFGVPIHARHGDDPEPVKIIVFLAVLGLVGALLAAMGWAELPNPSADKNKDQ